MKTKIKARQMFACYMAGKLYSVEREYEDAAYHLCDTPTILRHKEDAVKPVAVIDISDPEALVGVAAQAQLDACRAWFPGWEPTPPETRRCREYALAGLQALGILPRRRGIIKAKRAKK